MALDKIASKYVETDFMDKHFKLLWSNNDSQAFNIIRGDLNTYRDKVFPLIKNWRTCVQAGGNLGLYPVVFGEHFKRVFTFEPDSPSFYYLSYNAVNAKIIKINAALTDKPGTILLSSTVLNSSNAGESRVVREGGYEIFGINLDSFKIKDLDFLQLDIEGHEMFALQGARETLTDNSPVVALEMRDNPHKQMILDFMKDLGYSLHSTFNLDYIFVKK